MGKSQRVIPSLIFSARVALMPSVLSQVFLAHVVQAGALGSWTDLCLFSGYGLCAYLYGMWGNDAADAFWDKQYRPERPIPQGAISCSMMWNLSFVALALFATVGMFMSPRFYAVPVLLVLCITGYTFLHKRFAASVLLMGGCRALLLVLAACGVRGEGDFYLSPWIVPMASVLFTYVTVLTFWARKENIIPQRKIWVGRLLSGMPLLDTCWFLVLGLWRYMWVPIVLYGVSLLLRRWRPSVT